MKANHFSDSIHWRITTTNTWRQKVLIMPDYEMVVVAFEGEY